MQFQEFHMSDFDLIELRELLEVLERRLFVLSGEVEASSQPEGLGLYDALEATVGLAFVASQACLERIYSRARLKPREALARGPRLNCGLSVALVVHEGANAWKHLGERRIEAESKGQGRTTDVLTQLGVEPAQGYPLWNVLHAIKDQGVPDLLVLADRVTEWRDAVVGPRSEIPVVEVDEDDEL
jgi:hypothetical protein